MKVETIGTNKYLIRQVVRNGIEYTIEFTNKNGTCIANVHKYDKHKVMRKTKGELIHSVPVGVVATHNGGTIINDVTVLTAYGFKKYALDIVDAVFERLNKGEANG